MTELELLVDFHKDAERQGPGSEKETKRALDYIALNKTGEIKIADIGCGTGAQTITLARHTNARITAVDLFPEFLDRLKLKAAQADVGDRITTKISSMQNLPFFEEEYDIIWSEGAIYIMGFQNGIREWRKFIKPGGFLAVTEISWIKESRPKELETYWMNAYPGICIVNTKLNQLKENGYSPIAHFILPEYCWTKNYYNPIKERMDEFIKKHNNDQKIIDFIESEKEEIQMYDKYKEFYSYVFYIAQKN